MQKEYANGHKQLMEYISSLQQCVAKAFHKSVVGDGPESGIESLTATASQSRVEAVRMANRVFVTELNKSHDIIKARDALIQYAENLIADPHGKSYLVEQKPANDGLCTGI